MSKAGPHDPGDRLAEEIAQAIAEETILIDGRLPPERDLAARYSVSRARVRRALDELEQRGAVFRRQGQGTFAAPPPATESAQLVRLAREVTLTDIMEVRLEIEPILASLAAERASKPEVEQLGQAMEATLHQSRREAYEAADDLFHYRIAVAARNPLFLKMYESIRTVRKLATWHQQREESHSAEVMERFGQQHRQILLAISSRDRAASFAAMQTHLRDVSQLLLRSGRQHG